VSDEPKYPTINGILTLETIAEEKRKLGAAVRLRVESAGDFAETRILAIEEDGTEHEIRHVERIDIVCAPGHANRAIITATGGDFDVTATPFGTRET
jgi:hypothetical protein